MSLETKIEGVGYGVDGVEADSVTVNLKLGGDGGTDDVVDEALDGVVNDVQSDYFVDGQTGKTVRRSLKPSYARANFAESEREGDDLVKELYERGPRVDRSDERPTASISYDDDTHVSTYEVDDDSQLHPTGPRSESHRPLDLARKEALRATGHSNMVHETMRYTRDPSPRWIESEEESSSDDESNSDGDGYIEELHEVLAAARQAAEVYYSCGRKCSAAEKEDALRDALEAMLVFTEEAASLSDDAFEAEFMIRRDEYSEEIDYLNTRLTELVTMSGGAPPATSGRMAVQGLALAAITCLVGAMPR